MMENIRDLLGHWISDPAQAVAQPLMNAGGLSGARLWRVAFANREFALRLWPKTMSADRLASIHPFQRYLAHEGAPVPVPVPASATGQTLVHAEGRLWELASWMPGTADYWTEPRTEKLEAALRALAQLHVSAARMPMPSVSWLKPVGTSPGLSRREDRLHALLATEINQLVRATKSRPETPERRTILDALSLIERCVPAEVEKSLRWREERLPLQWVLRDVWHDHVLFTGDRVTGIVDFGAIGFDSPACDVARLLGSLVGDDPDRWQLGLRAYESVRRMTEAERAAVDFFDTSGTVLSTGHWIVWLWPKDAAASTFRGDRKAGLARLARLVERLRVLAARGG